MKVNFTLTQIDYVLAVHRLGHFAKASEACHVTQPTLSMQIQKLEDELEVKIFDRSKKPILTTEVGLKIIEKMKEIQAHVNAMDELVKQHNTKDLVGELRLGVIPTVTPYVIPPLIAQLKKKNPLIKLNVIEMQTDVIVDQLQEDGIDVGLLATPLEKPQIHEYPLFYEPFLALLHKDHALAQSARLKHSQLQFEDLWLLEDGHCLRSQIIDICSSKKKKSMESSYQFQGGSIETLKGLVSKVGGYTLLPQMATEEIEKNTKVLSFERPIPAREIGLVYRRAHFKIHLIEALGEAIINSLPADIRKLRKKDLDVIPV